jgi:alkanesulfonate monooxygenase SsuD/methylene tetrahydromethanopterin reductase-like flavin-dependent oxidoreductase (luciferase family)
VTSRIGIIATIHPVLFPPVVAAKMAATIDDLSGGLFGINIVTGLFLDEYEQIGICHRITESTAIATPRSGFTS